MLAIFTHTFLRAARRPALTVRTRLRAGTWGDPGPGGEVSGSLKWD